jgi:hypothetical protein
VEFDAGRRLLMHTEAPFPMSIEYAFSEREGGTSFSQRLQGGPTGLGGLFSPLMGMMVRRNIAADMERLRKLLEGRTG